MQGRGLGSAPAQDDGAEPILRDKEGVTWPQTSCMGGGKEGEGVWLSTNLTIWGQGDMA